MRSIFSDTLLSRCVLLAGLGLAVLPLAEGATAIRQANTTLRLPSKAPLEGFAVTDALGGLRFEDPVAVTSPPGETNRLFVVERAGRIVVVTNLAQPDKTIFLDVRGSTYSDYLEAGLLGLAFHPGYRTNRQFFVFRTRLTSTEGSFNALHDEVSRFEADPERPGRALPSSETRIFAQVDDNNTHNGGDLQFGPEGYLYISVGDASPIPARRSPLTKQPIDRDLFGGILRIDIDRRPGSLPPNPHPAATDQYAIPPDNPFVGVSQYQGIEVVPAEVRTELYAVGFRNPWRMGFDRVRGTLYVGEVGNSRVEEVNRIEPGANYGWPYLEADLQSGDYEERPSGFESKPPWITIAHGNGTKEGNCVIGGRVYRGTRLPSLQDHYLFADLIRGHIWAASIDNSGPASYRRLTADPGIVAFGEDPRNGEILLVNYRTGHVRHLIHATPDPSEALPPSLAETGAFADLATLTPHPGIVPYDINVPFWSDHAIKSRWFSVPDPDRTIGFRAADNWEVPAGTVWIKHFELEQVSGVPESRRRLETRFLVQGSNGVYGVTYRWDDSQTNAYLVPEPGYDETFVIQGPDGVRMQTWHYPGRAECRACHTRVAGDALGFNTVQLNRTDPEGEENQLMALSRAGYFSAPLPELAGLRRLDDPQDASTPLQDRVRSYLQANCTACHQPGGLPETTAYWDARIATPWQQTRIVDHRLIRPHDPEGSILFHRISTGEQARMPPLASSVLDTNAIRLLREWITTMPLPPWESADIGGPGREGSATMETNRMTVAGGGRGSETGEIPFHFLHQVLEGNGHVVARLESQQLTGPEARAGLMLRRDRSPEAPFAMASVRAGGGSTFEGRREPDGPLARTDRLEGAAGSWLRLVHENGVVSGFISRDGTHDWGWVGSQPVTLGEQPILGLAVTSHHDHEINLARFEEVSLLSITLDVEPSSRPRVAPATIPMKVAVSASGRPAAGVRYYNGAALLAERTAPPFDYTWSNAPAGQHTLRAEVFDARGLTVSSPVSTVAVALPEALGVYAGQQTGQGGDWKGIYAREGHLIVNDHTNLNAGMALSFSKPGSVTWELPSDNPRALERAQAPGRIAAAWTAGKEQFFHLRLEDGQLHRLALYMVDWTSGGAMAQQVDLRDGDTGQRLATRKVSQFQDGVWLQWTVRGHVSVHLQAFGSGRAILSGIFLDPDPNLPPLVSLREPAAGTLTMTPTNLVVRAEAQDPDGSVARVEFLANGQVLGEALAPPYQTVWSNVLAGTHSLQARAFDNLGTVGTSPSLVVQAGYPPAQARFIRLDRDAQGDWMGVYGRQGYALVHHATNLPPSVRLELTGRSHTWTTESSDPRALQRLDSELRIAACWVHYIDESSLDLHLELRDGRPWQVGLYLLDWDSGARRQSISVWDPTFIREVSRQEVSQYAGGIHALWQVQGSVVFRLERLQGNAVLSGIFFDAPAPEYLLWSLDHFSPQEREIPLISGRLADPDEDRLPNLLEYALGLDPRLFNPESGFQSRLAQDPDTGLWHFLLEFPRRREPTSLSYHIEATATFNDWVPATDRFRIERIPSPANNGAVEWVRYRHRQPALETPHRFFRLRIDESVQSP